MAIVRLELAADPVDPEAIDVWIDGYLEDEPCRFRLDTGANLCRIRTTEVTSGMRSRGHMRVIAGSGGEIVDDRVIVPLLRIGEHHFFRVEATRAPSGVDIDPLLGMSALGRHRCRFRFSAGQLELTDSTMPDSKRWFDLRSGMRRRRTTVPRVAMPDAEGWFDLERSLTGQPVVLVRLGDAVVRACWDTGSGLTAVDLGFARAHPEFFRPLRSTTAVDASGLEFSTELATMSACSIADVDFPESVSALVDLDSLNEMLRVEAAKRRRKYESIHMIIGMPLIGRADWDFDFPAARWTLGRSA